MSFSAGSSSTTKNTNSQAQKDPWDIAVPYLEGMLRATGSMGGIGLTPDQQMAFEQLKTTASQGHPWQSQIAGAANDAFNAPNRATQVGDAYTQLQGQIGDYASGKYLDPMSNPQMREMLTMVGDDISNRINAQFAGAGRDLSGSNQMAVARGVAQGQLPLLFDQFNKNQAMQMDAVQTLYGAGSSTATTQAQLDAARANLAGQGINLSNEALNAQNLFPNAILQLDQQIKQIPYEDLGALGSVLFPLAGLGEQQSGQSTEKSKTKSSGFGLNLSDERAKDGVEQIGSMADGTPIYRWRYKGDDQVHVGPMAQEVEQRNPAAVEEDVSGLKYVDMDAATRKAADIVKGRRAKKGGR